MLDSQSSFTKKCLWCTCRNLSVAGEEWTLLQWKDSFVACQVIVWLHPAKLEPVCMCGDLNRFCSFHPLMKWWVAQTGLWLLILQKSLSSQWKQNKKTKQKISLQQTQFDQREFIWLSVKFHHRYSIICCHTLGGQHHSKWAGMFWHSSCLEKANKSN